MTMPDEQELLTRTLHARADDVDTDALDLASVRSRARGIRRRRAAARGAVAAVVASLAVPGGLAVSTALRTPGDERPDQNIATRTPEPSPSTVEQRRLEGPTALTLEGLPQGPAPVVSYVAVDAADPGRAELVTPEGAVPLDELGPVQRTVPTDGGWLVLDHPGPRLHRLDRDGAVVGSEQYRAGQDLAVAHDGSRVLYVLLDPTDDAQLLTAAPTAGRTEPVSWRLPRRPTVEPVGFAGADTVVYQTTDPRGVTNVWALRPGEDPVRVPGLIAAAGAANGVVYGTTSVTQLDPTVCSGAVEVATGTLLWESCGYGLDRGEPVSPGGDLLAAHPYSDGYGPLGVAVLDAASGALVVDYGQVGRRDQVTALQTGWESDATLLTVLADRGTFAVVRLGVAGGSELAAGPVDGEPFGDQPFWLSE